MGEHQHMLLLCPINRQFGQRSLYCQRPRLASFQEGLDDVWRQPSQWEPPRFVLAGNSMALAISLG